jgi:hypothetical protein
MNEDELKMTKNSINYISATDARKDWSQVFDNVVREKPQFIRRTRDNVLMANLEFFKDILEVYTFTAKEFIEDDNSITLSLNEIDLVENGATESDAKLKLAADILEYAEDFYNDFNYWNAAPNRKKHIPYVLKALILQDVNKIGDLIQCQSGKI